MKIFSDKAQALLTFLQDNPNVDLTSKELAEATDLPAKSVTGVLNSLQKKGLIHREVVTVGDSEVKFIRLTADGAAVDPLAEKPEE